MTFKDQQELQTLLSSSNDDVFSVELDDLTDGVGQPALALSLTANRTRPWWHTFSIGGICTRVERTQKHLQHSFRGFRRCHILRPNGSWRWPYRRALQVLTVIAVLQALLIIICGTFFPSYSNPPSHYKALEYQIHKFPFQKGVANVNNEKVFIAAALHDPEGKLVSGDWGYAVTRLIMILGPDNVHLSLYENDADPKSKTMLVEFEKQLECNVTIVEEKMDFDSLPHITMPDGTRRLKRMTFLAEVRNRALSPLNTIETRFEKLLYLNDIVFNPADAANLLFSTNQDELGQARYRAVCAVDFGNPFKFYDTFATKDSAGFSIGVIFYPWFTRAGNATSRNEVLSQQDAVRVKSCWGGMVAFDAQWFQRSQILGADTTVVELPLRFRADRDHYWDSSECCLIHADLAALTSRIDDSHNIFMNPYVRVAYSKRVLDWIWLAKRVERLFTPVQSLVNWIAGRPGYNPRREENPGDHVINRIWVSNDTYTNKSREVRGGWRDVSRVAAPGGFCGFRNLQYLVVHPETGEKNWKHEPVPPGD